MKFPHLFSSLRINSMEIRNRIVMTAMHLGYSPEGEVTDQLISFYSERARGGVGMIIAGGCPVDEYGGMSSMIGIDDDRFRPGLKRLTAAVRENGAKIAAQLYQGGRYTHSSMIGGRKPFSASAVRSKFTGEIPRALELDEIPHVQDRFAEAALRAKECGFDAVEILGSAGYLISQFLSPLTNLREDGYGGSPEKRMRFGLEVVEKVRNAVGPDYPVLMRLAGNDFMVGGNSNKEASAFAAELETAGVDLFNVTGGWHETRVPQLTMSVPRKAYVYLAQGIKRAVSVPVIASNRINDPMEGEEVIRSGAADMVTMARGLLADPDLPNKAMQGKEHLIYHCVACNQGCFDSIFSFAPVTCLVNPRAGREEELKITGAGKIKRVLVIGGGAAGMKAAVTAAQRGHDVTIIEKENALGGQLLLNRDIPGRGELITAVADMINNLEASGVRIISGKEATPAFIEQSAPDAVVIATGSRPVFPDIEGIDKDKVVHARDILSGEASAGDRVVIVGGNAVGLETALYLAYQGTLSPEVLHFLMINRAESYETMLHLLDNGNKDITVLETDKRTGRDIGTTTRWTIAGELKRLHVKIMTGARAVGITDQGVRFKTEVSSGMLEADTVIIAAGSWPENGLEKPIKELVGETYVVGDAIRAGNALEAIREGFLVGLKI